MVGTLGFDPRTNGLKVRCSTTELRAQRGGGVVSCGGELLADRHPVSGPGGCAQTREICLQRLDGAIRDELVVGAVLCKKRSAFLSVYGFAFPFTFLSSIMLLIRT